jgi:hypothetical protein
MPVDAKPRKVFVEFMGSFDLVDGFESHFATCPNADQHRKPRS